MPVTLEDGVKRRIREDKILRFLVEGTVSETGSEFFRALARNLSEALQTYGAWVTEYLPESRRLRALAFWLKDGFLDHYEHAIEGTPCQPVIETKSRAHFPERLLEFFPNDPDLMAIGAVSYMGTPLLDADGTLIGHLAVLDNRPMPAEPQLYELFDLFAARAVAELRRLRAETAVHEREAQLSLLLDTAMDAILVLDGEFRITRLNPRATELFACTEEDLSGECFLDFLSAPAAATFSRLTKELQARPGERPLWLPEGLEAIRWDKLPVPAEAAISRYLYNGAPFYTVFLRSMSERLAAERRIRALIEETESLRAVVGEAPGEMGIVGRSAGVRGVCNAIRQVAPTDATVLILGETGTGKELVARAIHEASARRAEALVRVNCAAIPESLIESEFFGHEKGAFTGATARREVRFAQADGGTLFLDEVGELPLDLQAKLLRVLQEGEFEPLGGTKTRNVNVRVVAATNRSLEDEISDGRFREDLYYRLNVFPIRVPALRERGDDICLLAGAFVRRFADRMGRRFENLTAEDGRLLRSESSGRLQTRILTAAEIEELEKNNLIFALEKCGWRISGSEGVAVLVGLAPSTIASRMKTLGIRRPVK